MLRHDDAATSPQLRSRLIVPVYIDVVKDHGAFVYLHGTDHCFCKVPVAHLESARSIAADFNRERFVGTKGGVPVLNVYGDLEELLNLVRFLECYELNNGKETMNHLFLPVRTGNLLDSGVPLWAKEFILTVPRPTLFRLSRVAELVDSWALSNLCNMRIAADFLHLSMEQIHKFLASVGRPMTQKAFEEQKRTGMFDVEETPTFDPCIPGSKEKWEALRESYQDDICVGLTEKDKEEAALGNFGQWLLNDRIQNPYPTRPFLELKTEDNVVVFEHAACGSGAGL